MLAGKVRDHWYQIFDNGNAGPFQDGYGLLFQDGYGLLLALDEWLRA